MKVISRRNYFHFCF